MKFKRLCCVALAVSMLTTSSAIFTASAKETTSYKSGDVNLDGKITVEDIVSLYDYTVGSYTSSLTAEQFLSVADINGDGAVDEKDVDEFVDSYISADNSFGDVNRDGTLSVSDATYIQNYLVGNVQNFDLCQRLIGDYNKDGSVSVLDVTAVQKDIASYPKDPSFPTQAVKDADAKYRKEYADYIEKYNLADMLDGYYLLGEDSSSYLLFRDEKWGYCYYPYDNSVVLFDYFGNNTTEVLPSQLNNGSLVIGVGSYSNFSPLYVGAYTDIKSTVDKKSAPYSKLQNIFIPEHYKLWRNSFEANTKIKNVFFASKNSISQESSIFKNCTSLERVVLPSSMNTIPYSMFKGCTSLRKITIPESVITIEESAFEDTSISKIVFPKSVDTIEKYACATNTLREARFLNSSAEIHVKWASAYDGMDWPSLTVYGYKNSTLYDWWKQTESENLNVKIIYLD